MSLENVYAENYTLASRNFRLFEEAVLNCCFVKNKPENNDFLRPSFPSKAELALVEKDMKKVAAWGSTKSKTKSTGKKNAGSSTSKSDEFAAVAARPAAVLKHLSQQGTSAIGKNEVDQKQGEQLVERVLAEQQAAKKRALVELKKNNGAFPIVYTWEDAAAEFNLAVSNIVDNTNAYLEREGNPNMYWDATTVPNIVGGTTNQTHG